MTFMGFSDFNNNVANSRIPMKTDEVVLSDVLLGDRAIPLNRKIHNTNYHGKLAVKF